MFDDFCMDNFLHNIAFLWPIWVLLLCLILINIKFIIAFIKTFIQNITERTDRKYYGIIYANSNWYKQVKELNNRTKFYTEILDNGRSSWYVDVNSKPKFDKTSPEDELFKLLSLHRSKVERALEQVRRNRIINEVYCKEFYTLKSSVSPALCGELGIKYDRFVRLEEKVVYRQKLQIVHAYSITCYVSYVSPQGRNHYRKHCFFDESRIHAAIKELDKRNAYKSTEEWRRKNERTKVTPSLRYDVMRRDGFRCCLCGRTAANGVELEVDHIIPVSRGGNTTYSNLQTLCRDCNRGKGTKI